MDYQPREGVDYIVDLYQVAGVPQDAPIDEVKSAIRARMFEYMPDRLEGLAPEFRSKGERMGRLLTRANAVLLDEAKRSEYDEILTTWEGPISTDGTPVIRMDDSIRADMALMTPDEIEAVFAAQRKQIEALVKHDPKQRAFLRRMLDGARAEDLDEITEALDATVLAEDQVLAIEEAERGRLLGLSAYPRYETSLGYAEDVQLAIEQARSEQTVKHTWRMLGGVSTRLALLAGESNTSAASGEVVATSNDGLPHYFDDQAKHVAELAAQREELLTMRLEIFRPTYPIAELQTTAHPDFVIGITNNDNAEGRCTWVGLHFDEDAVALSSIDIPEEINGLLAAGEFEQVYTRGFNILTFTVKEQIDLRTLLEEAYNKHLQKFFPGALG